MNRLTPAGGLAQAGAVPAETAGYLPGGLAGLPTRALRFGRAGSTVEVLLPVLDAARADDLSRDIRRAGEALKALPVETIACAVDEAARRLLDREHPLRVRAERLLPVVTGYDPETVRLSLTGTLKAFRLPQLRRFLAADLPDPGMLDGFRPNPRGGLARAYGPDLLLHIWAGNVPGLPLWSLARGLLAKAGSIGKVSSGEPLLAGWFAQALAEVEPRLGRALAILCWKGGEDPAEQVFFDAADAVVAYGGNDALAAIARRLPVTTRFIGHGHKVSLGVVAREALRPGKAERVAGLAARDIARFEQQGCYAPQMIYVERGGPVSPRAFARHLAAELDALEGRHPRRALSLGEAAALANWRDDEQMKALAEPARAVVADPALRWAVSYADAPEALRPAALNRTVTVVALDDLTALPELLRPYRALLQTAGVAAAPERLHALAGTLGAVGVTRIAAFGRMTVPEPGWHNDGRFNLLELLTFTEIDPVAEDEAEAHAPYAD